MAKKWQNNGKRLGHAQKKKSFGPMTLETHKPNFKTIFPLTLWDTNISLKYLS